VNDYTSFAFLYGITGMKRMYSSFVSCYHLSHKIARKTTIRKPLAICSAKHCWRGALGFSALWCWLFFRSVFSDFLPSEKSVNVSVLMRREPFQFVYICVILEDIFTHS